MKYILFKKVPKNELGTGTEIAILKKYFDDKLIVDPKDIRTNAGARSYNISVIYNELNYNYEIKAYETQDYTKDRRLIVKSSDPIWQEREGQGVGQLNLAACHSCTLTPETTCELSNLYLDRSLVINNDFGYSRTMIE